MGIFSGRHFPREIILWAVRWYCRYGVSYRDLEEMMTERGVPVDHTTTYRWVQKYAPELDKQTRWYRQVPDWQASSWRVDETYIRVGGRWRSEEHTSELQSRGHLVCRLLLEKKN